MVHNNHIEQFSRITSTMILVLFSFFPYYHIHFQFQHSISFAVLFHRYLFRTMISTFGEKISIASPNAYIAFRMDMIAVMLVFFFFSCCVCFFLFFSPFCSFSISVVFYFMFVTRKKHFFR